LIEAHDGIFEIRLNDIVIYTNQSTCSKVPTLPEALEVLARHIMPLPGKEQRTKNAFPML
jgi:hypothetical protein